MARSGNVAPRVSRSGTSADKQSFDEQSSDEKKSNKKIIFENMLIMSSKLENKPKNW